MQGVLKDRSERCSVCILVAFSPAPGVRARIPLEEICHLQRETHRIKLDYNLIRGRVICDGPTLTEFISYFAKA